MAVEHEWEAVLTALDRLSRYRVLLPTLAAMRKLADMLKDDPAFADVHPQLSHASLILSRRQAPRRVYVGWDDGAGGYDVAFVGPGMELSEGTLIGEHGVVRVIREQLDRL